MTGSGSESGQGGQAGQAGQAGQNGQAAQAGQGGQGSGRSGKQTELPGPNYLKMAVSNMVAGSIIGKSGTNITQIASETGCVVRLSSNNCYFPGTTDRIVVISGELDKIHKVVVTILEHYARISSSTTSGSPEAAGVEAATATPLPTGTAEEGAEGTGSKMACRIVVPKSSVSAIIGLGGSQIKQLQETTGARIQISNREEGLDERVVHIQGNLEAIKDAAVTVSSSIQNDQNLRNHMYVDYPLSQQQGGPVHMGQGPSPIGGFPQYVPGQYPWNPDVINMKCEVFIQVPDGLAGSVIGRSGINLIHIADSTKAKITVSQKNEFYPGTQNRTVTMKGSVAQVHAAHILLIQKLNAAQPQSQQFQQSMACGVSPVAGTHSAGSSASVGLAAYGVQAGTGGYGALPAMRMPVGQGPTGSAQQGVAGSPVGAAYFQQQHAQGYHPYHLPAGQAPSQPWG